MRTAICLSGHMRTYEKTLSLFRKNLLEPLESIGSVDIFIHTWDKISTTQGWGAKTSPEKNLSARIDENISPMDVFKLYRPTNLVTEDFVQDDRFKLSKILGHSINIGANLGENDMSWSLPMLYKIYKCNELKKEHEKFSGIYDTVIRFRPDIYLTEPFPLELLDNLDDIYVDCGDDNLCGDVFWLSNSKNIDILSECYCKLNELMYNDSEVCGPETYLGRWRKMNNLTTRIFPVKVEFLRENQI